MNQFDLGIQLSVFTVFIQGLLSFFSPCVLPLIPVYIGYLSGGALQMNAAGEPQYSRKKTAVNTVFFVIGISAAFFLLGLGFSALGQSLRSHQTLISVIGGIVVMLFGFYQLGIFGESRILSAERRLPFSLDRVTMSPVTALIMGFVFSFSWTPCVGPTLSGVLLMATTADTSRNGFLLIAVYTLGFIIPFLAAGLFTATILSLFRKHRNVVRYTVKIGGILLILMGILMMTGWFRSFSSMLTASDPANVTIEEETSVQTESETAQEVLSDQTATAQSQETDEDTHAEAVYPAPDFEMRDQYGTLHRLSDYRGRVVFLNIWATWCPPCRAEMPDIQKLYQEFQDEGREDVAILGVAFPNRGQEQTIDGITAFLTLNGYTYPTLMDVTGEVLSGYYITAYPTTYMIDADGNIYGYVTGSMSEEIMRDIIDQTVNKE